MSAGWISHLWFLLLESLSLPIRSPLHFLPSYYCPSDLYYIQSGTTLDCLRQARKNEYLQNRKPGIEPWKWQHQNPASIQLSAYQINHWLCGDSPSHNVRTRLPQHFPPHFSLVIHTYPVPVWSPAHTHPLADEPGIQTFIFLSALPEHPDMADKVFVNLYSSTWEAGVGLRMGPCPRLHDTHIGSNPERTLAMRSQASQPCNWRASLCSIWTMAAIL